MTTTVSTQPGLPEQPGARTRQAGPTARSRRPHVPVPGEATAEIARLWAALLTLSLELTTSARWGGAGDDLWCLGEGRDGILEEMPRLEGRCRRTIASMFSRNDFDPYDRERLLDRHSLRRGIRLAGVCAPEAGVSNPWLRAQDPHTRCAPVFGPLLLLDGTCAVVPGLLSAYGAPTAWVTTRPDVVALARRVWAATSRVAVSPQEAGWPAVTERQLFVAQLVARGLGQDAIARRLGVSVRTVRTEVAYNARLVPA